jgi:hypothetical protein
MAELTSVQQQLAALLTTNHLISVRWDCGGDESFVTTEVDGQEVAADYGNEADFAYQLDCYLTELLELPDAGDFSMQGTGRIFVTDNEVIIEYQSEFTDTGDDDLLTDDEWLAMGLDPAEWRTEAAASANQEALKGPEDTSQGADAYYSGRRVLFHLA